MYSGHRIGVIVLAYKVEAYIKCVIEDLPDFIDQIYVIEDGSPDRTAKIVKKMSHPQVKLVRHEKNRGPGAALSTGYQVALEDGMDIIAKVDGDAQMTNGHIESLITPLIQGRVDYTKGDRLSTRANHKYMPRFRLFGNISLTWLTRIASGYWKLNDAQNGFTAISNKALQTIDLHNLYSDYGYLNDILIQLNCYGFRILDLPMLAKYDNEKSSIRLSRYVPKMSFLLLRRFLWRLWRKYFRQKRKVK